MHLDVLDDIADDQQHENALLDERICIPIGDNVSVDELFNMADEEMANQVENRGKTEVSLDFVFTTIVCVALGCGLII